MGDMAATHTPLTLIVAATTKNGIGKGGTLPWPMLKKEMAYFARVTKRVPKSFAKSATAADPVQNVVIMGRKTWDSIPAKLRPLKERTNLVITRQDPNNLAISHPDVIVASTLESALHEVQQRASSGTCKAPGRTFIIGGSTIYDAAMQLSNPKRVLLTRIHQDFDCDTFFPVDLDHDSDVWRKASAAELSEFVGEDVEDGDMVEHVGAEREAIRYAFQLYEQQDGRD